MSEGKMTTRANGWNRFGAAALVGLGLVVAASTANAIDLRRMSSADIRALQQRLSDAQCYTGPIDGSPSVATESALKRCPPMDPVLSIETGMHTSVMKRIGTDRQCR